LNPSRTRSGSHGTQAWIAAPAPPVLQDFSRIPVHSTAAALQTKLAINQPGDAHEQEANRVAEQVMRRPEPWLQRACACGGTCPKCRKNPASDPGQLVAPPIVHDVLGAPGQSLDPAARAFFEPRFGVGLANVRIHTNDQAGASARAVGARAYTVGRDVVFAPGQFAPGTEEGRRLLAHELTHVLQQAGGGAVELARVPDESGARSGRYTFSTNCGWIDWSHADPGLTTQLIQRVRQASDALRTAGTAATPTTGQLTTPTMASTPMGIVLSSANLRVRLLRPLSANEVNEVALSLFKTLSIPFEEQQVWTDLLGQSSFAQEDLPSNLIAFYMALNGYSRPDVIRICGGLDAAGSVAEYQRNHTFVRNRTFTPVGATGPWPPAFSTINDSAAAALYETERISTSQGLERFTFCPLYRVVGTIGERDRFLFSSGGVRVSEADDLRVVPTFHARSTTSGRYGHVNVIQVRPARPSDEAQLRRAGLSWPLHLHQPVLQCLTSHGNPG
jgi:hypothetical protein